MKEKPRLTKEQDFKKQKGVHRGGQTMSSDVLNIQRSKALTALTEAARSLQKSEGRGEQQAWNAHRTNRTVRRVIQLEGNIFFEYNLILHRP